MKTVSANRDHGMVRPLVQRLSLPKCQSEAALQIQETQTPAVISHQQQRVTTAADCSVEFPSASCDNGYVLDSLWGSQATHTPLSYSRGHIFTQLLFHFITLTATTTTTTIFCYQLLILIHSMLQLY